MKKKILFLLIPVLVFGSAACEWGASKENKQAGKNAAEEQARVGDGFQKLSDSQQIPTFDWSQERQTLIDVETIRATGATSTTAFYLEGIGMIGWCPSVGMPVSSTAQLSASEQWVDIPNDHERTRFNVEQGEPTGIYVGESSGTYTLCLDDNGKKFAKYWEGYVDSTTGIVQGYSADKRIRVTGATFNFTDPPK